MKAEQLLEALKDLAEKLGVQVSEQNFKTTGIRVGSGLCKIRGELHYILDKHKSTKKKIRLLAEALSQMPLDDIYIVPLVRETLERYHSSDRGGWVRPPKKTGAIDPAGDAAAEPEGRKDTPLQTDRLKFT
jgi:hypothetical protein